MSEFLNLREFSDLDGLKMDILDDFDKDSRFPVRFIFLNSYSELYEIVKFLSIKAKTFDIGALLKHNKNNDGWFFEEDLMDMIENIEETSVIYPVSEYLRFIEKSILSGMIFPALAGIENKEPNWNLKIYIPLVGLWNQFKLFWRDYYRRDEWVSMWKSTAPNKNLDLYQVCFDLKIENPNLRFIKNSKEWFGLWKEGDVENVISISKKLANKIENCYSYNVVTPEIINTPKDYISKILNLNINFEYNDYEKEFWNQLLIELNTNKYDSFYDFYSNKFNINNINNTNLIEFLDKYLNRSDSYEKWILKNLFVGSLNFKDSYLACCFNSIQNFDNSYLARKVYLNIFTLENSDNYLKERLVLLKKLNEFGLSFPEDEFEEYFKMISNHSNHSQFKHLTMHTNVEKYKILEFIRSMGFNAIFSDLKVIYPDLYYYLDWNLTFDNDVPDWVIEYFKEYNKSKVLDSKSPKIEELLNDKNSPDEFYAWYIDFKKNNNDEFYKNHLIWVDGLGLEWLPLLNYYLNKFCRINSKKISFKTIYSVELPSSTDFNKYDCDEKIEDLDRFIHKDHYSYPKSLFEEMNHIKDIAFKISKNTHRTISIVSDHGFSFLCTKKFGHNKNYKFESPDKEHEGRYVPITDSISISNSNEDYLVHGLSEKFIVALKHTTLNKFPSREVHGGATPEEVLVPYIIIEPEDDFEEYEILPLINEINVILDKELPIRINPKPDLLPIAICNNEKLEIFEKDNQYFIQLNSNIPKGNQLFIFKIDDVEVSEFEVKINKGGMMEENYDGLFG